MASKIYFTSIDSAGKYNLWVSDGSTAGTYQISTANAGVSGLAASSFAVLNGQPFFEGFSSSGRVDLFTVAGNGVTEIIAPAGAASGLSPGGVSGSGPIAFNGQLYFQGKDVNNQYGLFTSDGTGAGTVRLAVPGTSGNFYVSNLTRFGNLLAFGGQTSAASSSLYVTDGTAAGTRTVTVNGAYALGLSIHAMAVAGDRLVFSGVNASGKLVLWASDGTTAGTVQLPVSGLNPSGAFFTGPAGLLSFGNKAAFTATDAAGRSGVWVTDGTVSGTVELPGVTGNSYGVPMAALPGGRLAFIAQDAGGTAAVFVTDGTAVTELQVAGASASGLAPHAVMVMGGQLLFDGVAASGVRSLFTSDGTSAGTTVLQSGVNLVSGNIDTDAAVVAAGPTVAATKPVLLHSGDAAVVAAAQPGLAGDALSVSLLSDAGFVTGSTIGLNAQNQLVYTAGAVTGANAGADTLRFRVTDTVTGQFTDGSTTVTLLTAGQNASPDPLFDAAYYLRTYPDVAHAGVDPYQHYMAFGWKEGRSASALFDTSYYEQHNPDVAAAGVNPLQHFETSGWHEGRNPSAAFDINDYLAANPDVRAAGVDPLQHYISSGQAEGRAAFAVSGAAPDPLVDAGYIYATRPDVRAAGIDANSWFHTFGWAEHSNPDALFDTTYYLLHNPDVAAAHLDPLQHYETYGWKEGRDPSAAFSTTKYLAANPDVRAAGVDPLVHYVTSGQAEGRAIFPS